MAETAWSVDPLPAVAAGTDAPCHTALVRVTHWLTTVCFLALLVSGLEIVARHHSRRSIISKTQWPNRS